MARKTATQSAAAQATIAALGNDLVTALGALGEAAEGRTKGKEITDAAETKAKAIIKAAQAKAEEVHKAAIEDIAQLDDAFTAAYDKAVTAGWAPAQLKTMGYTRPTRIKTTTAKQPTKQTPPAATTPAVEPVVSSTPPVEPDVTADQTVA